MAPVPRDGDASTSRSTVLLRRTAVVGLGAGRGAAWVLRSLESQPRQTAERDSITARHCGRRVAPSALTAPGTRRSCTDGAVARRHPAGSGRWHRRRPAARGQEPGPGGSAGAARGRGVDRHADRRTPLRSAPPYGRARADGRLCNVISCPGNGAPRSGGLTRRRRRRRASPSCGRAPTVCRRPSSRSTSAPGRRVHRQRSVDLRPAPGIAIEPAVAVGADGRVTALWSNTTLDQVRYAENRRASRLERRHAGLAAGREREHAGRGRRAERPRRRRLGLRSAMQAASGSPAARSEVAKLPDLTATTASRRSSPSAATATR